jgi:hypothetical protein
VSFGQVDMQTWEDLGCMDPSKEIPASSLFSHQANMYAVINMILEINNSGCAVICASSCIASAYYLNP